RQIRPAVRRTARRRCARSPDQRLWGVVLSPPTLLTREPSRSVVRYADGVVSRVTIPRSATLALLAGATVLSRLPFLTPRLAHWDAVNYALGLHDFNVSAHQPHPPGSPYYILLGRAVLALVRDDNVALSAISLAASVLAVLAAFALAKTLFSSMRAALIAALLLATQPIFWGY